MIRLCARAIHALDGLFPRVRVAGRDSNAAYAEWEYEEGKNLISRYGAQFGALEGTRVLDVGCGLGGKTVAYTEAGAEAFGVDISTDNVAAAVRFAASRGRRARFVVGDAASLPFADASFGLVVANDSMEHFADPALAAADLSRILAPGGRLFLFFTPWRSPLGSHLYDYIRMPWCHLLLPERVIEEVLRLALRKRGEPDPAGRAALLMDEFRTELNRITVRRYRRIIGGRSELETVFERLRPPKFESLRFLTRMPVVGEFFTGTVVSLLRKSDEAADSARHSS
ncbi:MAG TPA: class I SAM-dependent methyltransferase [Candidatus Eisenbacteria bacterium]|uniref:Class I SAM-dependent methyltransferase n=1 Tax=Eiseniibacteriota bacterium TaxID=2212470 RepID=A0A7V2F3I6_UNCEI|nr:class I SAM-dependent methyltransferase [Candidatus Eisenbacteria bacterium]